MSKLLLMSKVSCVLGNSGFVWVLMTFCYRNCQDSLDSSTYFFLASYFIKIIKHLYKRTIKPWMLCMMCVCVSVCLSVCVRAAVLITVVVRGCFCCCRFIFWNLSIFRVSLFLSSTHNVCIKRSIKELQEIIQSKCRHCSEACRPGCTCKGNKINNRNHRKQHKSFFREWS